MAFFKKKMNYKLTMDGSQSHLDVMRANYHKNTITSKTLPKPLWIRLHRNDKLNVIYRDKDIVFQKGQIYYAYLVQANEMLFEKNNKTDLPANILYSTHPFAEKYPEFLMNMGRNMFFYKGEPEDKIPEQLREAVKIITDELDRSSVDFNISMPDPENPYEMIENIDVHFCSVIVFHKDIPNHVLQGNYLPVIAAPDISPAVLILPKEYWTAPFYDLINITTAEN